MLLSMVLVSSMLVPTDDQPAVKKSLSGNLCHSQTSQYYPMIKHYIGYDSLMDCVSSGGKTTKRDKQSVHYVYKSVVSETSNNAD